MSDLSLPQTIAVWIVPVLFAITLHEVAHGWVARMFGDPTAMMLGRLSVNPIRHVDPVGTVAVPLFLLLLSSLSGTSPMLFGWAKPVPVTFENLRNPKRDMAFVAAAGPLANLLMALFWALVMRAGVGSGVMPHSVAMFLAYMGWAGVQINVVLAVLNLLPVPPLDGGRIAVALLPGPWSWQLSRIEPYGIIIVIALLVTPLWNLIAGPPVMYFLQLFATIAGIR